MTEATTSATTARLMLWGGIVLPVLVGGGAAAPVVVAVRAPRSPAVGLAAAVLGVLVAIGAVVVPLLTAR